MAKKNKQYTKSLLGNKVLNYKVYVMKPLEKLMYRVATIVGGGVVGQIFFGGWFRDSDGNKTAATSISNLVVFIVVGLIVSGIAMKVINNMLKNRRISTLKNQFRDFLDSFASSLSSGSNVNSAIRNAYSDMNMQYGESAYMVKELAEMTKGLENNVPIVDMLEDFGNRTGVEDISNFAIVFKVAFRTGGNLKDIVRRTNDIISEKMIIRQEIETTITSNKMQLNIMFVMPIFITFMMRSASSAMDQGFSSIIGAGAMIFAVFIFVGAYKLGNKIMDIEG